MSGTGAGAGSAREPGAGARLSLLAVTLRRSARRRNPGPWGHPGHVEGRGRRRGTSLPSSRETRQTLLWVCVLYWGCGGSPADLTLAVDDPTLLQTLPWTSYQVSLGPDSPLTTFLPYLPSTDETGESAGVDLRRSRTPSPGPDPSGLSCGGPRSRRA